MAKQQEDGAKAKADITLAALKAALEPLEGAKTLHVLQITAPVLGIASATCALRG